MKIKVMSFTALTLITWSMLFMFIPEVIDRETHRQKVACEIDKKRGYPVHCQER